jgi:peptide-methionine (R)-S-oxide reductase
LNIAINETIIFDLCLPIKEINMLRNISFLFLIFLGWSCNTSGQDSILQTQKDTAMLKFERSEDEWKGDLSPEQYKVLRQCGTELPGTGKYYHFDKDGQFVCAACGQVLFDSKTKYASGSGWPSFYDVVKSDNVTLIEDKAYGMVRTEVKCARCGGHLGHVFTDGPLPTNLRYCINSVSIDFIPRDSVKTD